MSSTIKTYKNYVNGGFIRSESNVTSVISYKARSCNISSSTRKDLRNSLVGNRKAIESYSKSNALLRTQIIYRIAENLEAREAEFLTLSNEIKDLSKSASNSKGSTNYKSAKEEFNEVITRLVSLAGWPDKAGQLLSSVNPVSGDYFNTTVLNPVGVSLSFLEVSDKPLLESINKIILPIISGNTVTLVVDKVYGPLLTTLGEVLDASDVPAGVINILTADCATLFEVGALHYDVNLIEVSSLSRESCAQIRRAGALTNLKKIVEIKGSNDLSNINLFVEYKSIWQSVGY